MDEFNDMEAVIAAARDGQEPSFFTTDGKVAWIPGGSRERGNLISMERFVAAPYRARGDVKVYDIESFNRLMADNAGPNVAVYFDRDYRNPDLVAVLNGTGKDGPGWGDHRIAYAFRATPQWQKWTAINGKMMNQTEFAEFIEENQADVDKPSGAEMLEIATFFQARRNTEFKQAQRLSSGQMQFINVENIEAKVGAGQIEVPEIITLALAPLYGCPLYAVPARLRYRLNDGKLTLGIKLERIEDLMGRVLEDIGKGIVLPEGGALLNGSAPRPIPAA